jgi:hypothetical protein
MKRRSAAINRLMLSSPSADGGAGFRGAVPGILIGTSLTSIPQIVLLVISRHWFGCLRRFKFEGRPGGNLFRTGDGTGRDPPEREM